MILHEEAIHGFQVHRYWTFIEDLKSKYRHRIFKEVEHLLQNLESKDEVEETEVEQLFDESSLSI